MITQLVIATRNPDKAEEIKEIFGNKGFRIRTLLDFDHVPEIEEDGNTLKENALKKAREAFEALGLPVIADDTGLEVDKLFGAPGVYSARYAGENAAYQDNMSKLLHELNAVPKPERSARFRTVAAYYDGSNTLTTEGVAEGRITTEPRGENGFGYDPIFEALETKQTFAEMNRKAKEAISHRGRALRNLFLELQNRKILK